MARKRRDRRQYKRDWDERRKLAGLCASCGKEHGCDSVFCHECAVINRERLRARRNRFKNEGRCPCGNVRPAGIHRCAECVLKTAASKHLGDINRWTELQDKLIAQDHCCAYSGITLTLGKNASVEHVLPRAHHPHLSRDIRNLVWVDTHVNIAKHTLPYEDFINLCLSVVTHNGYTVTKLESH